MHFHSSYLELFERNHITYDLLPDLTNEWLDRMGFVVLGDRIRLEKALQPLKQEVDVCVKSHAVRRRWKLRWFLVRREKVGVISERCFRCDSAATTAVFRTRTTS